MSKTVFREEVNQLREKGLDYHLRNTFGALLELILPEKYRPRNIKIDLEKTLNAHFIDTQYIARIQWNKYNDWIWI